MTFGKAIVAALALVAAFALGVWTGPYLRDEPAKSVERAAVDAKDTAAATVKKGSARPERRAREAGEARETRVASLPASAPDVHKQLKPILNTGTDMKIAADGFRDAEQFATVAHAARNTQVPFMVLKHRVVEEGKSLAAAIEESKPQMDGAAEARRARAEARRDIAAINTDRRAEGQVAAANPGS